jgi:hypothetical protein
MKVRSRSDSERVSPSFRPLIFCPGNHIYITYIYCRDGDLSRLLPCAIYRVCCLVRFIASVALCDLSRLLPCRRPEEDAIYRVSTSSPTPLV